MAADQTLEWEVVTADGSLVTASPTENSDLYWALSGGGGGTYGVVVALTVKAYPDSVVAGAVGGFAAEGLTEDTYWDAVESFLSILPALVDAGAHTTFITQKTVFTLYEITIPGGAEGQIQALVEPWTTHLAEHNITYQLYFSVLPNFKAHVDTYLGPPPYGYDAHSSLLEGGVMFNRSTVAQHGHDIITHMRKIATTTDFFFPAFAFDASRPPSSPNALLPAWRESLMYLESQQYWNFSVPFQAMAEQERLMTEVVMPPLQDLASGAYMNEADFMNPRWKEEFYGENYGKLESIKKKWDPNDLFYATTAVGSEAWAAQQDGRLCRP
jgi:hypothetical protein